MSQTATSIGSSSIPSYAVPATASELVCAPSLCQRQGYGRWVRDHFAEATVSQNFKAYEGKPLDIPAEAASPKAEYLEWHRREVFARNG